MKEIDNWHEKKQYYLQLHASWLQTLNQLQEENICLRNRLVNALQQEGNEMFLERAESLQTVLEQNSLSLKLLRHEMFILNNILLQENTPSVIITTAIAAKHEVMESDLGKMQLAFFQLKADCGDLPETDRLF